MDFNGIPTVGTGSLALSLAANVSGKKCVFQRNQSQKKVSLGFGQKMNPSESVQMSREGPWNPEDP